MKLASVLVLFISAVVLVAADDPKPSTDPFAGAFFPPELIMMARDRIDLTSTQQVAFRAKIEKIQPAAEELRKKLEREATALVALAKQEKIEDAAFSNQLDRVLSTERELKHLQIGMLVGVKNLLTSEQQAKLRELAKDGGKQLGEEAQKRLTAKVDRIKSTAEKWQAAGRDPSEIATTMSDRIRPLIDAGKIIEAETELDRLLEKIKD